LPQRAALVAHWDKAGGGRSPWLRRPIPRHRFSVFPARGTLKLSFTPADGGAAIEHEIIKAPGGGAWCWACSISTPPSSGFARACFTYALDRRYRCICSTKNTILKIYDGRFKESVPEIFDREFKSKFRRGGPNYEPPLDRTTWWPPV